ncbi:hypothetical protein ACE41A_21560, partial [Bacillus cytotoxicus]
TLDLGSLAKLTKWKEGIADFHPNMGKNVVQSLKENETLKSALHTWKKTKVPVGIRSADTGMGIKIPHIEHATVGEIAKNFARVRVAAKEDAYQLAKGNGGSGVKGTEKLKPRPLKPTKDRISSSNKQSKLYKGPKRLTNAQRAKLIKDNFVKETSRTRTFTPQDMPGNKEFAKWFNNLTLDEFELAWADQKLRSIIESRIRYPGGLHEWHLVSRAPTFKLWGVKAEDIAEMRTIIEDVHFVNPIGKHGDIGSTTAHNELLKIIDSSLDYSTFKRRLKNWAHYRLKGGINSLPEGLR